MFLEAAFLYYLRYVYTISKLTYKVYPDLEDGLSNGFEEGWL